VDALGLLCILAAYFLYVLWECGHGPQPPDSGRWLE
jgi:hypothetical protein